MAELSTPVRDETQGGGHDCAIMATEWVGHRIKRVREKRGMSLRELYEATGIGDQNHPHQTLQKIETGPPGTAGGRNVSGEELAKIAQALDTTVEHLLGLPARRRLVACYGEIGHGGEYFPSSRGRWMEIRKLDAPVGDEEVDAVLQVTGDYLRAANYWSGDLLYFKFKGEPLNQALGKRCIVQLRDGGPAILGVLDEGSRAGVYKLTPLAGGPSREVQVEWAARIRWQQPAG